MVGRGFSWLTLTRAALGFSALLAACSDEAETPGNTTLDAGEIERDAATADAGGTSLRTSDGTEITSEALRCIYRQDVGASQNLSLQLQYISEPDSVAFAAYIDNPVPATPFVARPQDVGRLSFEVVLGQARYQLDLTHEEIAVHLDELPPPSSLNPEETVRLRGRLEVTAFSLPRAWSEGDAADSLKLAAGFVSIDCEAVFQESEVLD
jgi:hypothetical protein